MNRKSANQSPDSYKQDHYPTSPWTEVYAHARWMMTNQTEANRQMSCAEDAQQPILDALSAVYNS
ncbi:MAG: hypothetical protein K8L99_01535 [Anaerolineae bacterium]|nr:hypothetical protein [Anaerolineae bacterium]